MLRRLLLALLGDCEPLSEREVCMSVRPRSSDVSAFGHHGVEPWQPEHLQRMNAAIEEAA